MPGSRRLLGRVCAGSAFSHASRSRDSGFAGALLRTPADERFSSAPRSSSLVLLLVRLAGPSSVAEHHRHARRRSRSPPAAPTFSFARWPRRERRLLWRVRRKLIISYIFIGFIPAILIVAFFLLGGFLLFSNFSSYLVQTRLRELSERALAIADATALEMQAAPTAATSRPFSNAGSAPWPARRRRHRSPSCRSTAPCSDADARRTRSRGPGAAAGRPPGRGATSSRRPSVPAWIGCDGFRRPASPTDRRRERRSRRRRPGDDVDVLVARRGACRSPCQGYAVFVDMPVDHGGRRTGCARDTGVELTGARLASRRRARCSGRRPTRRPARAAPAGGDAAAAAGRQLSRVPRLDDRRRPARCRPRCS